VQWSIEGRPAYALLRVVLEPGESVVAQPGAFVAMKGDVEVITSTRGIMSAIARALFGGESMFLNELRAKSRAEIMLAPSIPGDIASIELRGDSWIVADRCYLAHHGDIAVSVAWRGIRGYLVKRELVWLKLSGHGIAWINSFGSLIKLEIGPGERMVVDNVNVVAMPADCRYTIRKFGSLKTLFFGGEGFVVEIEGPATVYLQSRTLHDFAEAIAAFLRRS